MKKIIIVVFAFILCFSFSLRSYAYILSNEEIYGEPEKGYEDGYEDALEESGKIVYRTREVSLKKYIADHETRFREFWLTFILTVGICVLPILVFRYGILQRKASERISTVISVVYNSLALLVIGYVIYRIDYMFPNSAVVVLWGIICKRILRH